jgi:acetate kinase
MSILVLNAGSSSLKLGLFDDGAVALASGSVDWDADAEQAEVRVRWLAGGEVKSSRQRSAPWASGWCRGARSCRRACASTSR